MMSGKIADVAMKHDASRVLQNCVKFGTQEQRERIANEVYISIYRN